MLKIIYMIWDKLIIMKSLERTLKSVSENPKYIFRLTIQGVLVGIFAGLMVCLYRFLLLGSESVLRDYLVIIHGNVFYIILFFMALAIMGLLIDRLTKWEVDSAGSGIPQALAVSAVYDDRAAAVLGQRRSGRRAGGA